jgi:hypothetical protein
MNMYFKDKPVLLHRERVIHEIPKFVLLIGVFMKILYLQNANLSIIKKVVVTFFANWGTN